MIEPLWYIWEDENEDCEESEAIVGYEYYPEFDLYFYWN